ncbi:MAG: hypothetical protein AMXMBFR84_16430 [Candidatus Hydrogenedentota bacterium]
MSNVPKISEAEWEVMRVLWEKSPRTAGEIVDAVPDDNNWMPRTVKSLLNRLVKKGAVKYEADGRTFYYSPAVTEEVCARAESRSLLERVYGGALTPMMVHLIKETRLSPQEIDELKRLLDKKGKRS